MGNFACLTDEAQQEARSNVRTFVQDIVSARQDEIGERLGTHLLEKFDVSGCTAEYLAFDIEDEKITYISILGVIDPVDLKLPKKCCPPSFSEYKISTYLDDLTSDQQEEVDQKLKDIETELSRLKEQAQERLDSAINRATNDAIDTCEFDTDGSLVCEPVAQEHIESQLAEFI